MLIGHLVVCLHRLLQRTLFDLEPPTSLLVLLWPFTLGVHHFGFAVHPLGVMLSRISSDSEPPDTTPSNLVGTLTPHIP